MNWIRRNWFYLVALAAAVAHAFKWVVVDWLVFALLSAAGLPTWLPALARYVKALKKTEKGWELELKEDVLGLPATNIEKIVEIEAQLVPPPQQKRTYAQLSLHARRVLKSLWHFQLQTFGQQDPRRWGFGVGKAAPDFTTFSLGSKELEWEKYVYVDPRSMVYLTNEGLEFCRQNQQALDAEPLYYHQFSPAPDA
jgi:hypothetical protein